MSGFDSLQEKLIQAKAVMNKVDGLPSNNTKGNLNETNFSNTSSDLPPVSNNFNTSSINNVVESNASLNKPKITEEAVKNSNLPDAIKQLMIDHPIPEVSFNNTIPDSLIEGAAEKMKKLSGIKPTSQTYTSQKQPNTTKFKTQKLTQSSLKNLVRETIKESLDELIDERISERMVESNGLKESIKLVVGNTIFEGKILTTKKIK